jgi:hypothetical protein
LTFTYPSWASSAAMERRDRRSPVLGLRRRRRFTRATSSGFISRCDRRPSHLASRTRLRSRAAFNLATRQAFSNWAMAPSTWRTRTAVGLSSRKKSGRGCRDEVDAQALEHVVAGELDSQIAGKGVRFPTRMHPTAHIRPNPLQTSLQTNLTEVPGLIGTGWTCCFGNGVWEAQKRTSWTG